MKTLAQAPCKAEILRRMRTVRSDSPRRWGKMSAHQMICHLSDAYRMALGQKAVSDASGLLEGTLIKWIALYLPVRWPAGIVTRPEIDQECGGTPSTGFAEDVAELERLVEVIATRTPRSQWPPHPIFGRMSHRAWMRWAYLHGDHHLRQFGA